MLCLNLDSDYPCTSYTGAHIHTHTVYGHGTDVKTCPGWVFLTQGFPGVTTGNGLCTRKKAAAIRGSRLFVRLGNMYAHHFVFRKLARGLRGCWLHAFERRTTHTCLGAADPPARVSVCVFVCVVDIGPCRSHRGPLSGRERCT